DPREHDVEEDQVGRVLVHPLQRLFAARGRLDLVAAEPEPGREHLEVVRIVIHDEDAAAVRPIRNTIAARGHGSRRKAGRRDSATPGPVTRPGARGRCRLGDEPHPSCLHTSLSSRHRVPVPAPLLERRKCTTGASPAPARLTGPAGRTYGSVTRHGKAGRAWGRGAGHGPRTCATAAQPRHAPCGIGGTFFELPRQVEVGMYYDEEWRALGFVAGLTLGMALGAGIALLLAPQSGRRTRR